MESSNITENMHRLLEKYRTFRGKSCRSMLGTTMWSVVVITTADEWQHQAFEQQIQDKQERKELPLDLPIHVVADPPGPSRIGNGGSTLTALEFLHNKYGESVYNLKILLIHAGGWSQRMPSATILGKVFAPIPYGEPIYQMLDLKLAMYLPFVPRLAPGVFLVCADDFLVYYLGEEECGSDWSIPPDGFTALAHPSPISIARTHGVYVVDGAEKLDTKIPVVVAKCLEVMQKPNDQRMKERGALLKSENGRFEFADNITMKGEVAYTDSSFYFGVDVMKRLLKLKMELGEITCEIDAYGDFLQALGPKADDGYIRNTSNISLMTSDLLSVRQQVFHAMRPCDIHLLVLNASKFIHIGTTRELLHHYCTDTQFQTEMLLCRDVFNCWMPPQGTRAQKDQGKGAGDSCMVAGDGRGPEGCVMHSVLLETSHVAKNSLVEYCHFDVPVTVEGDAIVSNCQWLRIEGKKNPDDCPQSLLLPSGIFLHTVSVMHQGASYFVTIFFNISDDLKASTPTSSLASLTFLNANVGAALELWGVPQNAVMPQSYEEKASLWTLKLYPGAKSMTESLELALDMVHSLHNQCALLQSLGVEQAPLFSLADALAHKDVLTMLAFRRRLFDQIQQSRQQDV